MTTFRVRTYNNIAQAGLERFPRDRYEVGPDVAEPDAILLRSTDLHEVELPRSLCAIGRAGSGVNNIPVSDMTRCGVPVFNAPGANANAVKELVVAGMLLAARNLHHAWDFARNLQGDAESVHQEAEAGKKRFVGFELPRRTLGVVGLGAIGVQVCNAALALGMRVVGLDPKLTVKRAWELSSSVQKAMSLEDLLGRSDFVTFHVPLNDRTRGMLDAKRIKLLKPGATVLNFARQGIVDEGAIADALSEGRLHAYVSDFPDPSLSRHPRVIMLPHLGASTHEAEEYCAIQVADTLREFLEYGNISHSVNFPETVIPPTGYWRMGVANANVPNMVGQITTAMAEAGLNIVDMINKSRGEVAYTLLDTEQPVPREVVTRISGIEGVLSSRLLPFNGGQAGGLG